MRIVKPTLPESMGVIVDTLLDGEVKLYAEPSEFVRDRIDIVYIKTFKMATYEIGIVRGPSVDMPMESNKWPVPTIPKGARALAKLIIHRCQTNIWDDNIVELG